MKHTDPHPLAGQTVALADGTRFEVDDWADRLFGRSWMDMVGNPSCIVYALRSAGRLPLDDEVLGGKVDGDTTLVHVTEVAP